MRMLPRRSPLRPRGGPERQFLPPLPLAPCAVQGCSGFGQEIVWKGVRAVEKTALTPFLWVALEWNQTEMYPKRGILTWPTPDGSPYTGRLIASFGRPSLFENGTDAAYVRNMGKHVFSFLDPTRDLQYLIVPDPLTEMHDRALKGRSVSC